MVGPWCWGHRGRRWQRGRYVMAATEVTIAQREAADPRASVWVAASAGAGKTKALTDRVLRLLLDGTAPQRLLCLTFTRAAAAEMANRVNSQLGEWTMMEDAALDQALESLTGAAPCEALRQRARRQFATVLDTPGRLKILTIVLSVPAWAPPPRGRGRPSLPGADRTRRRCAAGRRPGRGAGPRARRRR